MKEIPCIKNKCLLYPACKNKEEVECEEVRQYYWDLRHGTDLKNYEIWAIINQNLSHLEMIGEPRE